MDVFDVIIDWIKNFWDTCTPFEKGGIIVEVGMVGRDKKVIF